MTEYEISELPGLGPIVITETGEENVYFHTAGEFTLFGFFKVS